MANSQFENFYNIIKESGKFDEDFYLNEYPEVKFSGEDPIMHYVVKGARKLYNPSPSFNTDFYLHYYPDLLIHLKKVGFELFNPFVHYIKYGEKENRITHRQDLFFDITANDLIENNELLMNRLFFYNRAIESYNEELNSINELINILYANFDIKAKGITRLEQLLALELLRLIDVFCRKNGIEYWLDSGTLLGAVRHNGYIPWDDDLDIGMMRKDFKKFLDLFLKEISKNSFLKDNIYIRYHTFDSNWHSDPNFLLFAQIIIKKPLVNVDIFIHDNVNLSGDFRAEYTSIKKQFWNDLKNNRCSIEEGLEKYNSILKVTDEKTSSIINAIDSYPIYRLYNHNDIFPLKSITFENYIFYCPNNIEKYLIEAYGPGYKNIPKAIGNHNRINYLLKNQFSSEKEAEIFINKTINSLKESIYDLYSE